MLMLAQHLGKPVGFGNVTHDQPAGSVRDGRHVPLDKIVIGDRIVTVMEQPAKASTANVSGPAGQENLHR